MNGKVHHAVNLVTATTLISLTVFAGGGVKEVVCVTAGSIGGVIVTPDYDLDKGLPRNFIGNLPFVGKLWRWFWWPYAKLVKHRSFISHSFVFSTIGRVVYIAVGFLLVLGALDIFFSTAYLHHSIEYAIGTPPYVYLLILAPWCIQDGTHLVLDSKLLFWIRRRL